MRAVRQRDDEVGFSRRPVLDPDDLQLLANEGMVQMRNGDRFTTVACEQGSVLRTLRESRARYPRASGAVTCGRPAISVKPRPGSSIC